MGGGGGEGGAEWASSWGRARIEPPGAILSHTVNFFHRVDPLSAHDLPAFNRASSSSLDHGFPIGCPLQVNVVEHKTSKYQVNV